MSDYIKQNANKVHKACKHNKYMKHRVHIPYLCADAEKNRAYCVHYSSAEQPHKAPKGQRLVNRNNGKNNAPAHTYITNH